MHIAYIRVSTEEQSAERQHEGMKQYPIEKTFEEKVSGKNTNRPKLQEMLDFVREGDVIHIHDFSRLARNTADLLKIVEDLTKRKVALVSTKEQIDTSTPQGKLMLTMIGAIAEFERANLLERQREGIEIAKREGKYKDNHGVKKTVEDFPKWYEAIKSGKVMKVTAAKELGITRPTLDRMIREYEQSAAK